jgi:hypothetical protein
LNPSSTATSFSSSPIPGDEKPGDHSWRNIIKRKCMVLPCFISKLLNTAFIQTLSRVVLIKVDQLSINLNLPTHESAIKVSALQCLIYASSKRGHGTINMGDINNEFSTPQLLSTSTDGRGLMLGVYISICIHICIYVQIYNTLSVTLQSLLEYQYL